jgi:hypothetical protein
MKECEEYDLFESVPCYRSKRGACATVRKKVTLFNAPLVSRHAVNCQ